MTAANKIVPDNKATLRCLGVDKKAELRLKVFNAMLFSLKTL